VSHDIVGIGEAMLRMWVPAGERLEDASSYRVSAAGAEANVAVAAARMGARTAWLSALPDNPLGRRAAREIAAHGVDVSGVRWVEGARMGTYYVELSVPPRPITVVYDRARSAASLMGPTDVDWAKVESARVVHISGITPALSPSCLELSMEVVRRAAAAGTLVSIDVNYRKMLWEPDECRDVVTELAQNAGLIVVTAEDARDVFGIEGAPEDILDGVIGATKGTRVVVTLGARGAHWHGPEGRGSAPGYEEAQTIDRIGAGDAMAAGVLLGLLDDDLPGGVRRGIAMSALKLGIYGDQMTVTPAEVEQLLAGHDREVSR
jgi:2-dehydro-3-deoxygluconokinase